MRAGNLVFCSCSQAVPCGTMVWNNTNYHLNAKLDYLSPQRSAASRNLIEEHCWLLRCFRSFVISNTVRHSSLPCSLPAPQSINSFLISFVYDNTAPAGTAAGMLGLQAVLCYISAESCKFLVPAGPLPSAAGAAPGAAGKVR